MPDIRIELRHHGEHHLARRVRRVAAGVVAVIRIDAVWLAVDPVDTRAGPNTLLARVVEVFGAARSHHGYLFANARGTRLKLLVHDGFGLWCAARRLSQGRFRVAPRQRSCRVDEGAVRCARARPAVAAPGADERDHARVIRSRRGNRQMPR